MTLSPRMTHLLSVLERPERLVLGLMSGTSLDGLDLALCRFSGAGAETRWELLHWKTEPYTAEEQMQLRPLVSAPRVDLAALTVANAWLAERHGEMVLAALSDWGVEPGAVACLASHGQTVFHAPSGWAHGGHPRHATLQLGDGDLLASRTGILTVSDFRQKEIAAGGEGAPLAPYAEQLLFGGAARARVLINLGGIANFTWLPPAGDARAPVSGDTGPGNTLLDLAVRRFVPDRPEGFDRGGRLAAAGRLDAALLAALKAHPYFQRPFPRSTGPELFGGPYLDAALAKAGRTGKDKPSPADLLATLTALSAETLAEALRRETPDLTGCEGFLSGGGSHNGALVEALGRAVPELSLRDSAELGVPADAKEAVLFAALANESLWGEGFSVGRGEPGPRVGFGKISLPG